MIKTILILISINIITLGQASDLFHVNRIIEKVTINNKEYYRCDFMFSNVTLYYMKKTQANYYNNIQKPLKVHFNVDLNVDTILCHDTTSLNYYIKNTNEIYHPLAKIFNPLIGKFCNIYIPIKKEIKLSSVNNSNITKKNYYYLYMELKGKKERYLKEIEEARKNDNVVEYTQQLYDEYSHLNDFDFIQAMYIYIHLITDYNSDATLPKYDNYHADDNLWKVLMDYGFGVCQNYNSFIKRSCVSRGIICKDYIYYDRVFPHVSLNIYLEGRYYNINTVLSWDSFCEDKEYTKKYPSDIKLSDSRKFNSGVDDKGGWE